MAYFCKICSRVVRLKLLNGVLELAVDVGSKTLPVDKCPTCNNPLNTRDDLKYVPPKEKKT